MCFFPPGLFSGHAEQPVLGRPSHDVSQSATRSPRRKLSHGSMLSRRCASCGGANLLALLLSPSRSVRFNATLLKPVALNSTCAELVSIEGSLTNMEPRLSNSCGEFTFSFSWKSPHGFSVQSLLRKLDLPASKSSLLANEFLSVTTTCRCF